jgi:hypothetical protein
METLKKVIHRFKKLGGNNNIEYSKFIKLDDDNNIIFDENSPEQIKELEELLCSPNLDIITYFTVRNSLQLLLETNDKNMINEKNIQIILQPISNNIENLKTVRNIVSELTKISEKTSEKYEEITETIPDIVPQVTNDKDDEITSEKPIEYEEKQEKLLCGKHAINFLLGCEDIVNDSSNPDREYIENLEGKKAYNLAFLCKNKDVILERTDSNTHLYTLLSMLGSTGEVECDIVDGNYSMNYMLTLLEILKQSGKIGSVDGPKYFINETLNSNAIVNYINMYNDKNVRGFLIHVSGKGDSTKGHWLAIKMNTADCNNKPSLYDSLKGKHQCMEDINQQVSTIQTLIDYGYTQLVFLVINEISKEPTTVTKEVIEEPSIVTEEVIEEPTTVTGEVIEEPTTVTEEVIEEPTTVTEEVIEEPSTVTEEVIEEPSESIIERPISIPSNHGKFKFHIKMKIPYITIGNVKIDKEDIKEDSTPIAYKNLIDNNHSEFENISKKYDTTNKETILKDNDVIHQILYDPHVSYKPTFNIAISNYIKNITEPIERELVGIAIKNALHNKLVDTIKIDKIIDDAIKSSTGGVIRRFKRNRK